MRMQCGEGLFQWNGGYLVCVRAVDRWKWNGGSNGESEGISGSGDLTVCYVV